VDDLKEFWEKIFLFLKEYSISRIVEVCREMDWSKVASNPVVWLVTLAVVGTMIWKQQIKLLVGLCSLVAFLALLQYALPPAGQSMEMDKLVHFVGGSAVLAAVNLYFLFVRQ
jgi:hypothetical protein